ncbi:hypothetical protein P7L78_21585 [Tistrella bauzanensis]|uniref:Uncharacterized protein n=1 Tax=Tistrella arctica TaxID=3133430 RepID=A0ABU9YS11_9PROT
MIGDHGAMPVPILPDDVSAHVFICTGFETLRAAIILIEKLDKAVPVFLLWFGGSDCPYPPQHGNVHVEEFPTSYRASLRVFHDVLDRYPPLRSGACAVYIPHIIHFAANFFARPGRYRRLALLPDGMINYADRRPSPSERVKSWAKAGLGLMQGVPYRPIWGLGHITGYDRLPYDLTYTFDEKGLISRCGQLIVLPRSASGAIAAADPRVAVVLDQEISELLDTAADASLRRGLIGYLTSRDFATVYYKAHPKGVSRHEELVGALTTQVVELPGAMPVEDVVTELGAGEFVSFYSTGLVSLRQMTNARVTAVLPSNPPSKCAAFFRDVEGVFRERDISIHKVVMK